MLNSLFNNTTDPTINLVSLAPDAALMRQTAFANNIANINSVNYHTLEVNFEQQLEQSHSPEDLVYLQPYYQPSEKHSPLDEQIALNIKNMTHYRALIKGLNQKLAIIKLALQGNNAS